MWQTDRQTDRQTHTQTHDDGIASAARYIITVVLYISACMAWLRNTWQHSAYRARACCPLMSHVVSAPRALLRLENTGQTDGRTPDCYITLNARRDQRSNNVNGKYCDEHVCVSVCLSATISPEPWTCAISSGTVTEFQGQGQFWRFSSPLTMHCTA